MAAGSRRTDQMDGCFVVVVEVVRLLREPSCIRDGDQTCAQWSIVLTMMIISSFGDSQSASHEDARRW